MSRSSPLSRMVSPPLPRPEPLVSAVPAAPGATTARRGVHRGRVAFFWAPLLVLECYLAATVLIFFWGPVDWRVPSPAKLTAFLIVNYGALWLGYGWGIKRGRRVLRRLQEPRTLGLRVPRGMIQLVVISMLFSIASSLVRVYAIRDGLFVVLRTFLDPGQAYRDAQLLAQMQRDGMVSPLQGFAWAFRISVLLAALNIVYFPVALACWKTLRFPVRVLFFAAVASNIIFAVGLGLQSGIALLFFSLMPVAVYKLYVEGRTVGRGATLPTRVRRSPRRMWTRAMVAVTMLVLVATVITFQIARQERGGRALDAVATVAEPFGTGSARFPHFGERFDFGLQMLCLYVSHGYEGLALSMEVPFQWTYGVGWSKGLQTIIRDYLAGPDIFQRSYMVRTERAAGWPALTWWSTIFPWIASDTTFYGTAVVVALMGWVLGRCWLRLILTGNPMTFAVLAQLFTLVFMFPANFNLAQTLEGVFGTAGTWLLYLMSCRYFGVIRPAVK